MKWKDPGDNFGRRNAGDRRKKSISGIEKERRRGIDRRKNPDRRKKTERREIEDSNSTHSKSYKKRDAVNRRDIIFGEIE